MHRINIVYKNIDDIIPYENNPRNNDDAVEPVANSIQEFGFRVPIVVDKDNIIVAGHTRHKAAKKLGITDVPVIIADDLDEDQIKAFRFADNKTGELAGWNFGMLELELGEIDMNMEPFGFKDNDTDIDIDGLFTDAEPKEPKEPERIQCPHCGEWFER